MKNNSQESKYILCPTCRKGNQSLVDLVYEIKGINKNLI